MSDVFFNEAVKNLLPAVGRAVARPDLGVLMVLSNQRQAEQYQRVFDPRVMFFVSVGGALVGRQFRAIFVAASEYERSIQHAPQALASLHHYLDHIRCRLAPGCTENFFTL